jgi:hypothetical protein
MDDPLSKDGGRPPKAHEGWGLLLETGEQISSWDKKLPSRLPGARENVFPVGIHIINKYLILLVSQMYGRKNL